MHGLLLDTCAFIFILEDNAKLSKNARSAFLSEEASCYLSHVSLIEIEIKHSKGKIPLPAPLHEIIEKECAVRSITLLPLDTQSIFRLATLPQHHNDPFDRLLISQAMTHDLTFITPDRVMREYNIKVAW